jgi:hypothetical protein
MLEYKKYDEIQDIINDCIYTMNIDKLADIARELLNDLYRNE